MEPSVAMFSEQLQDKKGKGMQEGSSPTDDLNAIGVLKRREIEARVIAPLVEELSREFGHEKVLGVLKKIIVRIADQPG